VLTDLLEVGKGVLLAAHNGGHTTEGSLLELLTAVERVTKLEETNIVLGNLGDQVASSGDLTEGKLVVVLVVKDVEQAGKERVEVVKDGELGKDAAKLLVKGVLGELDLAHVEVTDTRDLEAERGSVTHDFAGDTCFLWMTVGVLRMVELRTTSMNSLEVGTGAMRVRVEMVAIVGNNTRGRR
jgi:hypothetical protein